MERTFWRTALSKVEKNKITVRGYKIEDLIGNITFAGMIYLLFKGEIPDEKEEKLMNALLVGGCEHSITCPSVAAARLVVTGGVGLQNAIASGINALGDYHGGAIEFIMKILYESLEEFKDNNIRRIARDIVRRFLDSGQRVPGYGHFLHTEDPRVKKLVKIADKLGYNGKYLKLARLIENELSKALHKKTILNIDGVMGAIFCELGFDWRMGKALFSLSRVAGIAAHAYEEMINEKPFKVTPLKEITYYGPDERAVNKD